MRLLILGLILVLVGCFSFQARLCKNLAQVDIKSQLAMGQLTTEFHGTIPTSKARLCNKNEMKDDGNYPFKGQEGEDKELFGTFGFEKLCEGTYLEIGGLDGLNFSNSYVFKQSKNWNGVLVEASPKNYANMIKNRPDEIAAINAGICTSDKDLHFVETKRSKFGGTYGFLEFAPKQFWNRNWSEEDIKNAIVVKCKTLTNVLMDAVGPHFYFDFFSLDTEGSELDILLSLDFRMVSFGVVFVEHRARHKTELHAMAVKLILEKNGYRFLKTMHGSDWFVNENFGAIYKDLLIYGESGE